MKRAFIVILIFLPIICFTQSENQESKNFSWGITALPIYELNTGFGNVENGYGLETGIYLETKPNNDFSFSFGLNLQFLQQDFFLKDEEFYPTTSIDLFQNLVTGHLDYKGFSVTAPISLEFKPQKLKSFLIFVGIRPILNLTDETFWTYSEKRVDRQTGTVLNEIEERTIPFAQRFLSLEFANVGIGWYSSRLSICPVISSGSIRFFKDFNNLNIRHRTSAKLRIRYKI